MNNTIPKDENKFDGFFAVSFKDTNVVDIQLDGNINYTKLFSIIDFLKKDLEARISFVNLSDDIKNIFNKKPQKEE